MINDKDDSISEHIKLLPFKKCKMSDLYDMYQDIPKKEIGSANPLNGVNYNQFEKICHDYIKEETQINPQIGTTTSRFILFFDDNPIGEVGIRTTFNEFWMNKGSQIYYKIRKSERGKGYGNKIFELALKEARKLGFTSIRVNCNNKNLPSKKIIIKHGGILDIDSYKTSEGYSSSYIIHLFN